MDKVKGFKIDYPLFGIYRLLERKSNAFIPLNQLDLTLGKCNILFI